MTFPIDGKMKVMFQTTNQSFFISCSSPRGLFLSPRREQYSEDHPGSSKWLVTLITLVSKLVSLHSWGYPIYIYHIIYDLYIYIYTYIWLWSCMPTNQLCTTSVDTGRLKLSFRLLTGHIARWPVGKAMDWWIWRNYGHHSKLDPKKICLIFTKISQIRNLKWFVCPWFRHSVNLSDHTKGRLLKASVMVRHGEAVVMLLYIYNI